MLPVSPDCPLLIAPLVCLTKHTEDKPKGQSIIDNPETLATLGPQDTEDKPKGQSIMDNPETLATLGPQDTERKQTKGAINNGQSGDTGNIRTTRH
jgi:hypothetical protein